MILAASIMALAHASDDRVAIVITVPPIKDSMQSWDGLGGPPDLEVCWEVLRSEQDVAAGVVGARGCCPVAKDTFQTQCRATRRVDRGLKVTVDDDDLSVSDGISAFYCAAGSGAPGAARYPQCEVSSGHAASTAATVSVK